MSRPPDHERIYAARRAGTLERLVGEGIPRPWAEAWLASWEGGAADIHGLRRDPDFWEQGYQYAHGAYERGERPPAAPDTSSDERDPAP
jgi:hypothetical protein